MAVFLPTQRQSHRQALCLEVKSHEDIQFDGVKWHPTTIKESPFSQALSGSHRPKFAPPNGDLDEQRATGKCKMRNSRATRYLIEETALASA